MTRLLFIIIPLLVIIMAFHTNNSITVSGKVTDNLEAPLPGVTVQVKGTPTATTTASDGTYTITVEKSTAILLFSAVGYITKEIKINSKATINAKLQPITQRLEEVVITGYSSVKKKDITGSITYVSSVPYQTQNTLAGKASGVQIRVRGMPSVNGQPGANGYADFETESYDHITENSFHKVTDDPLSTFSIDVDAASYSNIRRFINDGKLPPAGAVRIEEMVNYFKYQYPQPINEEPFSINTEIATAPWNADHQLVLIGLQGKKIPVENLPSSNIVFLIDVSGSMQQPNKIGLVKASMKLLVDQLRPQDKVAMVVYAGAAGLVLPSTSGEALLHE